MNSDEYYYHKYTKYKTKYLNLYEELYGGNGNAFDPSEYRTMAPPPSLPTMEELYPVSSSSEKRKRTTPQKGETKELQRQISTRPRSQTDPSNPPMSNSMILESRSRPKSTQLENISETGLNVNFEDTDLGKKLKNLFIELHNLIKMTYDKLNCCFTDIQEFNKVIMPRLPVPAQQFFKEIEKLFTFLTMRLLDSIRIYRNKEIEYIVNNDNIGKFVKDKFEDIIKTFITELTNFVDNIMKFDKYFNLNLADFPPYNSKLEAGEINPFCRAQGMNVDCIFMSFVPKFAQLEILFKEINKIVSSPTIEQILNNITEFNKNINNEKVDHIQNKTVRINIDAHYDEKTKKKKIEESVTYKPLDKIESLNYMDPSIKQKTEKLINSVVKADEKKINKRL